MITTWHGCASCSPAVSEASYQLSAISYQLSAIGQKRQDHRGPLANGVRTVVMNSCVGVGTPASLPIRTTAPLWHGTSGRLLRSISSKIDDFDSVRNFCVNVVVSSISVGGNVMPRAVPTGLASSLAVFIIFN